MPENGSGAVRGVGSRSDAVRAQPEGSGRVASRGRTAPGAPIGYPFPALIFFASFLYQDKKDDLTKHNRCLQVEDSKWKEHALETRASKEYLTITTLGCW